MTSSTKIQRKQTSLTVYVVLIEGILKGTHQAKKTARGRLSPAWFENLNINLPEFCNLHSYALFWSRSAWFWIKNAKFEADWPYFFETVRANCKMRVANISYVNIIYSNFHQYIFDADFESGFFDNFGPSKFLHDISKYRAENFDGPKLSKNPLSKSASKICWWNFEYIIFTYEILAARILQFALIKIMWTEYFDIPSSKVCVKWGILEKTESDRSHLKDGIFVHIIQFKRLQTFLACCRFWRTLLIWNFLHA